MKHKGDNENETVLTSLEDKNITRSDYVQARAIIDNDESMLTNNILVVLTNTRIESAQFLH